MSRARLLPVVVVLPAVLLLSACGGGDGGGTTNASPTSAAGAGGPGGGQFRNSEEFQKIQQCLTAAGISLPTPSGTFRRPTGTPGEGFTPPSGAPDGTPPSGGPRNGGGRGGGFGQMFSDPQVKAALDACGITVPTGRPSNGSRPSATASA